MTITVPLVPGQSRDRVSVGDDWMKYVSLGSSVMVGEFRSEEEEEEEEEEKKEEGKIDNDDDDLGILEADC